MMSDASSASAGVVRVSEKPAATSVIRFNPELLPRDGDQIPRETRQMPALIARQRIIPIVRATLLSTMAPYTNNGVPARIDRTMARVPLLPENSRAYTLTIVGAAEASRISPQNIQSTMIGTRNTATRKATNDSAIIACREALIGS